MRCVRRLLDKLHPFAIEAGVWMFCVGFLVYVLREALVFGTKTFVHENFQWALPVFHFFAERISDSRLPLWNPYSHAGEPLYPYLGQFRLLEPLAWLVAWVGSRVFTRDTLLLFNWNVVLGSLFAAVGGWLSLRRLSNEPWVRAAAIPPLVLSTLVFANFRQDGLLSQYLWAPWVLLALLRLIERESSSFSSFDWLFLGLAIGMNFQSYHFTGVSFLILFLGIGFLADAHWRSRIWARRKSLVLGAPLAIGVAGLLSLPNFTNFLESKRFVYPARYIPEAISRGFVLGGAVPIEGENSGDQTFFLPYVDAAGTGTHFTFFDWVSFWVAGGNPYLVRESPNAMRAFTVEAAPFLGTLVMPLALFGLFFGTNRLKRPMAVSAALFALLSLGPHVGLFRLLYFAFPPTWLFRHAQMAGPFLSLHAVWFCVLGLDALGTGTWKGRRDWATLGTKILGVVLFVVLLRSPLSILKASHDVSIEMGSPLLNVILLAGLVFSIFLAGRSLGLWLALTAGIAGVWSSVVDPSYFAGHYGALALVPLAVAFLAVRRGKPVLAVVLIGGVIALELGFLATEMNAALTMPTPRTLLDFDTAIHQPLKMPTPRLSYDTPAKWQHFILSQPMRAAPQAPRYGCNFTHEACGFSPPYGSLLDYRTQEEFQSHVYVWSNERDDPRKFFHRDRWNSMLALKSYWRTIKGGARPEELIRAFRIGGPSYEWIPAETSGSTAGRVAGAPSVEVAEYDPDRVVFKVDGPSPGILRWADGFDVFWGARVGGERTPISLVDGCFKAVAVPAGSSTVEFIYRPWPWMLALAIFMGTAIGVPIAMAALSAREFRSRRPSAAPNGRPSTPSP